MRITKLSRFNFTDRLGRKHDVFVCQFGKEIVYLCHLGKLTPDTHGILDIDFTTCWHDDNNFLTGGKSSNHVELLKGKVNNYYTIVKPQLLKPWTWF